MESTSPPSDSLPALLPNPRQREELRRQFQLAMSQLQSGPRQAAEGLKGLLACVNGDPANSIFIEALLRYLRSQAPQPVRWFAWLTGQESAEPRVSGNWTNDWKQLWERLASQPRNGVIASRLAALAEKVKFSAVEALLRRYAVDVSGEELQPQIDLALMLVRQGVLEEAAALWSDIADRDQQNPAAKHFLNCWLTVTSEWSFELKSSDEFSLQFQQKFQDALRQSQFAVAQQLLTEYAQQSTSNTWLTEWQEELFLMRAEHALRVGERLLGDALTPVNPETIEHLRMELLRRELDQFSRRMERQPERTEWQWEAALRLKQLGNFSGAIQLLEPLIAHESWRAVACLELAENWQRLRQFDRALGYYADVLAVKVEQESPEHARALAQGGRLAAALGKINWPA